jgi:hypothetical protein
LRVAQLAPKVAEGSAVLVTNSTQVLVAPLNNTQAKESNTKRTKEASIKRDENSVFRDPIASFLCHKGSTFLRVLPKSLSKDFQAPPFTLVSISEGKDENKRLYIRSELVRLEGGDLTSIQFATLILLPKSGNGLTGEWKELFDLLVKVI